MFANWVLRKWLFVFILMVLVNPLELANLPGPSNIESLQQRKRRIVAECRTCGYKAYKQVTNHTAIVFSRQIISTCEHQKLSDSFQGDIEGHACQSERVPSAMSEVQK